MNRIRFDTDDIQHITLFEKITGATIKDFIQEANTICFLVKPGDMGLAIGKKGVKIERIRKALGRSILVLEFNEDAEQLLRNLFHPLEVHGFSIAKTSDGTTTATVEISRTDRSRAIGQNGSRIKIIRALAKRHCNIDDINLKTV